MRQIIATQCKGVFRALSKLLTETFRIKNFLYINYEKFFFF